MGEGSQDSQSWQARWIFRSFNNFSWHSDLVLRTGNFSKRGGCFFFFLLYKTMTIYPLAFSSLFVHKTAKVCSGKTHFIPQIHDALIIYHGTLQWQDTSFMKPCIRINPAYPQWHLALLGHTWPQSTSGHLKHLWMYKLTRDIIALSGLSAVHT